MKLVLFDIDGTLIRHIRQTTQVGFPRFEYAIKHVYGIDVHFSETGGYNGTVDKHIVRSVVPESMFSKEEFDKRWPKVADALFEYANRQVSGGKKLYQTIDDAVRLAYLLKRDPHYTLGLLTGNVERMAYWKLCHAGIPDLFSFTMFSDMFDDRLSLTKSVFEKVKKELHVTIKGKEITIIGDSIHDVRCGKAIGARTIAVTTGMLTVKGGIHGGRNNNKNELEKENPDLCVDSLMDKKVLDFFGLKGVQQKNI